MQQIKPSVTNPTIADIYEKIDLNKLVLAPDFQRKFVWTHDHQEQFLDTILNGYPFPEIYVCQGDIDTKKLRTTQKVIDGQQRLTTIKNYIENNFSKPLKIVTPFDALNEEDRANFLSYQIVIRDIGKVEDDLVKEIFRRINLTKFKLEDIEIHNAIYDGHFISTAKELAAQIDLKQFDVFYESEMTRMADVNLFLLVMSTIERDGYFPRDNELEKCVAEFNDEYPNAYKTKSLILKAMSIIKSLGLANDSIWFRKSCFFTMIVELCWATNVPEDLVIRLNDFDQDVLANKNNKDSDYGMFYHCMYSGTNDRKARVIRSEIFKKYILG
ncbi:DUF262 domain-containing protein [Edwardsiella ictaluri]|uniref:DUF262 domain-containing protein n=1 Tax=Edwardsiella ictaluri TaxID=67780 RepID=A0ABY8GKS2_EDWIC|nr:DUF262 domain-containing protein [Edwardsiella ictaluri]ELV7529268.1 DUF262 domain-containing protein [Edwardsiella ictaluri]KMQ77368.1 hypothetical protein ABY58_14975 [Edwardsiella ictaluri]KOO54276.1 hypothetical protein ACS33_14845 [Edwardsiella ictaluri]WFN97907.1 DUF262 domain-containing protein [Edwardsiella ictaluri]